MLKAIYLVGAIFMLVACSKLFPKGTSTLETLDGETPGLSDSEKELFLKGDALFNDLAFDATTGLGPIFNATSCVSCHAGDGKGHPFSSLVRFGQGDTTGNAFFESGAPQWQQHAILGFSPEILPANAPKTRLIPPANAGLGFLEALTDEQLLAFEDPFDKDIDGISGRAHFVVGPSFFIPGSHHISKNGKFVGRFGYKAGAIDLLHQTANALQQDMGINTVFQPIDTYSRMAVEPEMNESDVHALVFYLKTLKHPPRRNETADEVKRGELLFQSFQCAKCHIPSWKTPQSSIGALSNKTFYPYTDLLLHDMGEALNDGYTEGTALPQEWRTTPLWGLGLAKKAQGGSYYLLHDGRARSIKEAILFHGGEAKKAKENFEKAAEKEQFDLIQFLESL